MDSGITIRRAEVSDAAALVRLRECMLNELDAELGVRDSARLAELARRSKAWFEEHLVKGDAAGWLAEREGRVVGGVSMTVLRTQPQYRSLDGDVAMVYGLFVEESERGRGLATELVRTAVLHARESGADLVTLHAAEKARPIYERLGFAASTEMRLFLGE
jgi:GNAT superfamily N-acetyltransferase